MVVYRYQRRVSNIIDDVLEWDPRLALSGMMDSMQSEVNGTESNNVTGTDGGSDEYGGSKVKGENENENEDESTDEKDLYNDDN